MAQVQLRLYSWDPGETVSALLKQQETEIAAIKSDFLRDIRRIVCNPRPESSDYRSFFAAGGVIEYQLILFDAKDTTTVTVDHCEAI